MTAYTFAHAHSIPLDYHETVHGVGIALHTAGDKYAVSVYHVLSDGSCDLTALPLFSRKYNAKDTFNQLVTALRY